MSRVNGYSAYQNNYHDNSVQNKKGPNKTSKTNSSKKADGTGKTNNNVQLSDRAKALLQELKKKYSNMDFIVGDYESDEEAASYLSRGTKEYSVLIDAEELESMASDDEIKNRNLSLLDEAVDQLDDVKNQLGDSKDDVLHIGIKIGKDGELSYFAELEKSGERQKEFVERIREGKKEAAEEKASANNKTGGRPHGYDYERSKHTTVYASSTQELIDKIKNVDWDDVKEETTVPMPGDRFNFSI